MEEFWMMFRKMEPDEIEMWRREEIAGLLKQKPSELKDQILKATFNRLRDSFDCDSFGIISPCRTDQTRKEKFEAMYVFSDKLRRKGLYHIAHKGFWDYLDSRCFFIPRIDRRKTESLASEVNQNVYCFGDKRDWKCYEVATGKELNQGSDLRVIEIDEEFFIYERARKLREHLTVLKEGAARSKSGKSTRQIISAVNQRIHDLIQMENAMVGGSLWK